VSLALPVTDGEIVWESSGDYWGDDVEEAPSGPLSVSALSQGRVGKG
jgi:hypothetical protein